MDTFGKKERSAIMQAVKSTGNASTELRLMRIFRTRKITGWRRHYRLFGTPDFAFPTARVAVFVDGCFWHGHPCRNIRPAANRQYWDSKIAANCRRDSAVNAALRAKGWSVVRIRECELKGGTSLNRKLKRIAEIASPVDPRHLRQDKRKKTHRRAL